MLNARVDSPLLRFVAGVVFISDIGVCETVAEEVVAAVAAGVEEGERRQQTNWLGSVLVAEPTHTHTQRRLMNECMSGSIQRIPPV